MRFFLRETVLYAFLYWFNCAQLCLFLHKELFHYHKWIAITVLDLGYWAIEFSSFSISFVGRRKWISCQRCPPQQDWNWIHLFLFSYHHQKSNKHVVFKKKLNFRKFSFRYIWCKFNFIDDKSKKKFVFLHDCWLFLVRIISNQGFILSEI